MLEVDKLSINYGQIKAVEEASFKVEDSQCLGIIGSNGAGKSSVLNAIGGLISNYGGKIFFNNQDLTGYKAEKIVSSGLSLVPERRQVFSDLTVEENLLLGSYSCKYSKGEFKQKLQEMWELFPALQKLSQRIAGTLSGGEQQMLVIARGLMSNPKLLLLDEPTLGLAPLMINHIMLSLKEIIKQKNISIVVAEQNTHAIFEVASEVLVLEMGKVVLSGKASDLQHDPRVKEAFLGKEF